MRSLFASFAIALAALASASAAHAAGVLTEPENYRIEEVSSSLSSAQAGAHADFTTTFRLNEKDGSPYALTRDIVVSLPPGLVGNPEAFPKCSTLQLASRPEDSECPLDSQVGSSVIVLGGTNTGAFLEPVYNLPSPGGDVVARFGLFAGPFPAIIKVRLDPDTESLVATVDGAAAAAELISSSTTFWGVPANPAHDTERITPEEALSGNGPAGGRPSNLPEVPFMTNPTSCEPGQQITITTRSYQLPNQAQTKTGAFPDIVGCEALGFNPAVELKPTTSQGTTGSGLDYELDFPTKGLEFGNIPYDSELRRAEVTLPEGMTINPSEAEGLGVCSEADLARETYDSGPNAGCPESSKIGSVEAETSVIDRNPTGSLYLAKPYQNPFGSLLALYMVLKIPDRGVLVKLPGEVVTDPDTGQITTIFDNIPQVPVSTFHLHFREGSRAPLVTPSACGTYNALSLLGPWSRPDELITRSSLFSIESGPGHGPCPSGGLPPFKPLLLAYATNPIAGSFSPFYVRLTRTDAEQEITHFSIKLPPGFAAKLAGVPFCPDAAIAAAKARSGIHGGEEELNAPSCPAASEIGTSSVGAGVGDVLTYVPGKLYLAGPYRGSPISIVAITAAKAGPFDLGTVVVREALRVNPETAEVFVDANDSDPIPHIIRGIPVHLRDIRISVDRPRFAINPTDCSSTSTASTVRGAGLDFVSEADDNPLTVSSPFQVADCAALGFKPKLRLFLKGGTKRNQVPALKAVLTARPGDANISKTTVVLPHSEFLEQGHIGTVCTRAQFNAGAGDGAACPPASVYGRARATTPLLDEALEGPVFLRSNGGERQLPDLVAALHSGKININLVGYIDSVSERNARGEIISRIRNRFEHVPDAPVTKFVLLMKGGKKGLLVNSTDICKGRHQADIAFSAHNGRQVGYQSQMKADCRKKKPKRRN